MVSGPQISLKNLSLSFGEELIFDNLNLLIHPRERMAFVGRNGSVTSPLLPILRGWVVKYDGAGVQITGLALDSVEHDQHVRDSSAL